MDKEEEIMIIYTFYAAWAIALLAIRYHAKLRGAIQWIGMVLFMAFAMVFIGGCNVLSYIWCGITGCNKERNDDELVG
jgi:hypothetical protein